MNKQGRHPTKCAQCGRDFLGKKYVGGQIQKYCTIACRKAKRRQGRQATCLQCGKGFEWKAAGRKRRAKGPHCSRACTIESKGGGPGWLGGTVVSKWNGYRYIRLHRRDAARHTCGARKSFRLAEHVAVVESVLGRCLKRGEVVHHINGDQLDNQKRNLLVCSNGYHRQLHGRMSYLYQREHFGGASGNVG